MSFNKKIEGSEALLRFVSRNQALLNLKFRGGSLQGMGSSCNERGV